MLLVARYKQHGTIHDATLLKATVACYNVASCMVAFRGTLTVIQYIAMVTTF